MSAQILKFPKAKKRAQQRPSIEGLVDAFMDIQRIFGLQPNREQARRQALDLEAKLLKIDVRLR